MFGFFSKIMSNSPTQCPQLFLDRNGHFMFQSNQKSTTERKKPHGENKHFFYFCLQTIYLSKKFDDFFLYVPYFNVICQHIYCYSSCAILKIKGNQDIANTQNVGFFFSFFLYVFKFLMKFLSAFNRFDQALMGSRI